MKKIAAIVLTGFLTSLLATIIFCSMGHAATFKYGGIQHDLASTATAAGTTTLTKASLQVQRFTGASTQTVVLPAANTLSVGYWYLVTNESSGAVTLQDNGANTLATIAAASGGKGRAVLAYVANAGSANGTWALQFINDTSSSQPLDATLTSISLLGTAANKGLYTTGVDTWAEYDQTAFARTLLDDANQAAMQTTLGLVPGTNVQTFDATLASIAALGTAADRMAYTTGVDTWAETPITAAGRALIDDASAAAQRTTLGIDPATSAIAALDIDWATLKPGGGLYTKTLGANSTFTFSNRTAGQTIVVRLTNTASNYTVTWPTVKWTGGVAPTMTVGAKSDVYTFIYDGTDVFGSYVQNF